VYPQSNHRASPAYAECAPAVGYKPTWPGKWEKLPDGVIGKPVAVWKGDSYTLECDEQGMWTETLGPHPTFCFYEMKRNEELIQLGSGPHRVRVTNDEVVRTDNLNPAFEFRRKGAWTLRPSAVLPMVEVWRTPSPKSLLAEAPDSFN